MNQAPAIGSKPTVIQFPLVPDSRLRCNLDHLVRPVVQLGQLERNRRRHSVSPRMLLVTCKHQESAVAARQSMYRHRDATFEPLVRRQ